MLARNKEFDGFSITFNTGEDCNLACTYCYEIGKKKTTLPLSYAEKFIDLILEQEDPVGVRGTKDEWILNQGLILDFIGGDSLMHPELVDSILEYFLYRVNDLDHRWKHRWRASITSNGTLFKHKAVRDLIKRWHQVVSLTVSIDGCPALHDLNRIYPDGRGSSEDIEKYWSWFRSLYPKAPTKSTLSKGSIPYMYDSLVYMHEGLALDQINQNFIFEDMELEESDLEELDRQFYKCVNYVLEHRDELFWSMIDLPETHDYKTNCELNPDSGWCGSGMMPALSPNGRIYPCFRFLPHTQGEQSVDMSVGTVHAGFSRKEKFREIRMRTRETISEPKCKECAIESGCAWCIAGSYAEPGEVKRQTYICEVQKLRDKWSKIYWEAYNDGRRQVSYC